MKHKRFVFLIALATSTFTLTCLLLLPARKVEAGIQQPPFCFPFVWAQSGRLLNTGYATGARSDGGGAGSCGGYSYGSGSGDAASVFPLQQSYTYVDGSYVTGILPSRSYAFPPVPGCQYPYPPV